VDGAHIPGWVQIVPAGIKRDSDLAGWLNNAINTINEMNNPITCERASLHFPMTNQKKSFLIGKKSCI
jgi:hypothetical protein